MILDISNLGEVGVISDIRPHALSPNALQTALNVRFRDGQAERMYGETLWHTLPSSAFYLMPYDYAGNIRWLTVGSTHFSAWDAGLSTDITPVGLSPVAFASAVHGFVFNGVAILNAEPNVPFGWVPDDARAEAIPGWDTAWRAKVFAPFKNLLMAFNLTESGVNYPTKYRWSSLANPGALPASWDETDPTITAGSDVIDETQAEILAAVALGEYMVVYTRFSAHLLQFVGGQFVLSERPLLKNTGVFAPRCAAEFFRKHFVVSDGDVVVHDGQTPQSILKGRLYERIFPTVCADAANRSYVVPNWAFEEMWFCYPESGVPFPNMAAAWSWKYNTWQIRELGNAPFISAGQLDTDAPDTSTRENRQLVGILDNNDGLVPSDTLVPTATLVPRDGTGSTRVLEASYTDADLAGKTCIISRTGLRPDASNSVWMLRSAYPRANGGAFSFRFGSHDSPDSTVTWSDPIDYTPNGASDKMDMRVTGRYLAFEATFPASAYGSLEGIGLDIVKVGKR